MKNLITWNTQGEGDSIEAKIETLEAAIGEYSPCIIMLQDAGSEQDNEYIGLLRRLRYTVYDVVSGYSERYRLITAVNNDITVQGAPERIAYESSFGENAGARRPLFCQGVELSLYNFYNITNQRMSVFELQALYNYINDNDDVEKIIVAGDFNIDQSWSELGIDEFTAKRHHLDYVTCKNITMGHTHHIETMSDHDLFVCEIDI